jgi:transcriptional regulator with XRE-family HTH domain
MLEGHGLLTMIWGSADERLGGFLVTRSSYGCTQAALAKLSGVSLRSIQMYEQRNKDINKASAESLYRISKVLGCTIEDLLEKKPGDSWTKRGTPLRFIVRYESSDLSP